MKCFHWLSLELIVDACMALALESRQLKRPQVLLKGVKSSVRLMPFVLFWLIGLLKTKQNFRQGGKRYGIIWQVTTGRIDGLASTQKVELFQRGKKPTEIRARCVWSGKRP